MVVEIIEKSGKIKLCKSCMEARGYQPESLLAGVEISNMVEYAQWIAEADKILTF